MRGILVRRVLKTVGAVHRAVYRAGGGRVGGRMGASRSAVDHDLPEDREGADDAVVFFLPTAPTLSSSPRTAARKRFPAWWLNLLAQPQATVEVGRSRRDARLARPASPEERARLWAEITAIAPGYLGYQRRTGGEIPLAILQPGTRPAVFPPTGVGAAGWVLRFGRWSSLHRTILT